MKKVGEAKKSESPSRRTKNQSRTDGSGGRDVDKGEARGLKREPRYEGALVGGWRERACGQSKSADRRVIRVEGE